MAPSPASSTKRLTERFVAWPLPFRFLLFFAVVAAAHGSLLRLPYFWDEGGYYVPAALDFYHRWTLIPEFTNAHPPLPNVVLGLLWHLFGYHVVVTRLAACAFAAGGLLALFELTRRLLDPELALAATLLTAVYPIWFAQSSLAHADIFAAASTLAGLAVYLTAPEQLSPGLCSVANAGTLPMSSTRRLGWACALFCLAVLAKETALLWPVVLLALQLFAAFRSRGLYRRAHWRWCLALLPPVPLLALWFGYHRWKTGFTFGNPTFLRYNATANLTVGHIARSFEYRALHLFWQRDIWLPLVMAVACLALLPRRTDRAAPELPRPVVLTVGVLVLANWVAFSVLGGALLTRYLLPVYPLLLLVCVSIWQSRTAWWPGLTLLTAAAFLSALWLNPPTYFAPEDNLTYRDMIVVHQEAIRYLEQHDPDATVLTAWPAAAELFRPELGYTEHRFKVFAVNDFTAPEVAKAAAEPQRFDTALVFTTHFIAPEFRSYLLAHPNTRRAEEFLRDRDLSPLEIATRLGGRIVWQDSRGGEWAAVIRFDRRYDALLPRPGAPFGDDDLPAGGALAAASVGDGRSLR